MPYKDPYSEKAILSRKKAQKKYQEKKKNDPDHREKIRLRKESFRNPEQTRDYYRIRNWKKSNIKGDYNELLNKYKNTNHCDVCNIELIENNKGKQGKRLDHDHMSGYFRHILCNSCNLNRQVIDNNKEKLLLDIHRYHHRK